MTSFEYTIQDELGLHARPAGELVKRLKPLDTRVTVVCGDRRADAKRIFALMTMAVKCGETVRVEIEGGDEEKLKDEILAFFEENY
ncbi:MAG: HPr family phosphocarrier protein [Oscillospiraceae bacterium]|nr:HPr family phosphocarrier protein [Oscillospiraceae bacterium]